MGDIAFIWMSKKQSIIILTTYEAKYMSVTFTCLLLFSSEIY